MPAAQDAPVEEGAGPGVSDRSLGGLHLRTNSRAARRPDMGAGVGPCGRGATLEALAAVSALALDHQIGQRRAGGPLEGSPPKRRRPLEPAEHESASEPMWALPPDPFAPSAPGWLAVAPMADAPCLTSMPGALEAMAPVVSGADHRLLPVCVFHTIPDIHFRRSRTGFQTIPDTVSG